MKFDKFKFLYFFTIGNGISNMVTFNNFQILTPFIENKYKSNEISKLNELNKILIPGVYNTVGGFLFGISWPVSYPLTVYYYMDDIKPFFFKN